MGERGRREEVEVGIDSGMGGESEGKGKGEEGSRFARIWGRNLNAYNSETVRVTPPQYTCSRNFAWEI